MNNIIIEPSVTIIINLNYTKVIFNNTFSDETYDIIKAKLEKIPSVKVNKVSKKELLINHLLLLSTSIGDEIINVLTLKKINYKNIVKLCPVNK